MDHITLHSDYIFSLFNISLTNSFLTTLIVTIILSLVALYYSQSQKIKGNLLFQSLEVIVYQILNIIDQITKNRQQSKLVLPLIATFFLFIVTANLLALLPGFLGAFYVSTHNVKVPLLRSPNSDLTTTVALALVSILATQIFSVKMNGWKVHLKKYFNFKTPLTIFIGFMAMISEGAKVLSFSFRLFGNIFAGEVLLLLTGFLIPYIIPIPFMLLELFVGIIQSYIFALLTLNFMKESLEQT